MSEMLAHYTIKDMPEEMRPRERLLREGAERLSDAELLAIVLHSGSGQETAVSLATRMLVESDGLRNLAGLSIAESCRFPGVGPAKAAQVKAALELGRRLGRGDDQVRPTVRTPDDAASILMEELRYLDREHLVVLCLDTKHALLARHVVSIGTVNASVAHPRECFKEAIRTSATAVLFVHNHPSGDPTPSREDVQLTHQLTKAGELLGIDVLDHVVIGDGAFVSLKDRGLM